MGRSHCSSSQCPPRPFPTSTPRPSSFFGTTFNQLPFPPSLHLNVLQIQDMSPKNRSKSVFFTKNIFCSGSNGCFRSGGRTSTGRWCTVLAAHCSGSGERGARQELVSTQHQSPDISPRILPLIDPRRPFKGILWEICNDGSEVL